MTEPAPQAPAPPEPASPMPAPTAPVPRSEQARTRRPRPLAFLLPILAVVGMALALNGFWNPSAPVEDSRALAQLGMLLLLLLFVGSAFLGRPLRAGQVIRGIVVWSVVFLMLVAAYAYRSEISLAGGRILGAFAPGVPIAGRLAGEADGASVVIGRGRGGQFAVRARVEDVPVTMLVDTGASLVTLTIVDAASVGVDIRSLAFTIPIRTANGVIRAAPITIQRLAVGTIVRERVRALVAPPDTLGDSLLGMSFLETLKAYAISGDRLVLSD